MADESPANLFGKGVELPIGDTTYKFLPLRLKEWAMLEEYLRTKRTRIAMKALDSLGVSEAEKTRKLIHLAGMAFMPGEVEEAIKREPDVGVYIIWLSLRRSQPDITQDEFEERFAEMGPEGREKLHAVVSGLASDSDTGHDDGDDADPTIGPTPDGKSESVSSVSSTPRILSTDAESLPSGS